MYRKMHTVGYCGLMRFNKTVANRHGIENETTLPISKHGGEKNRGNP